MSAPRTGALLCAALAAVAALAGPAPRAAAAESPAVMLTRMQSLYRRAEQASETYDGTKEKLDAQQTRYTRLAEQLAGRRAEAESAREAVGALAREQYRGGGLSSYARLLLSDDPTEALDQAHILARAAVGQSALMRRARAGEHALATAASRAGRQLRTVRQLAARQLRDRDRAKAGLDAVEKAVASLTDGQLSALVALQDGRTDAAQRDLLGSGALGAADRSASPTGRRAVSYAVRQLGKPYVWGAQGPGSLDCSGLTSQAGGGGPAIPGPARASGADCRGCR